jgi:hypothetical protein
MMRREVMEVVEELRRCNFELTSWPDHSSDSQHGRPLRAAVGLTFTIASTTSSSIAAPPVAAPAGWTPSGGSTGA